MRSDARNGYKLLQKIMKFVCMMYGVPIKRPLEAEEPSGQNTSEGVHAVICD